MKYLNKIILIFLLGFTITACDDLTELELLDNPNAVTPENAGPDFLYNNIQLTFRNFHNNFHFIADGLVRYTTMGAFTYNNALNAQTGNGSWNNAYANLFPDIDAIINLNDAEGREGSLNVYEGNSLIMKAYVMTTLVDYYVNVPFTESGQGTDIISPSADEGSTIYAAADALLDEAITLLESGGASPSTDIFYGGSVSNWITLAKTMKLRNALHTRLTNSSAGSTIKSIVDAGDVIDENSEDFVFEYGKERDDPGSRHPFYGNHYESGDGTYMGTYVMWTMCCEKQDADGNEVRDPRIRYYFYRQVPNSLGLDVNVYSCILSDEPDEIPTPPHYASVDPRMPYCVASTDGYYGRDHGNGSGIPPDGPIRTRYGLYPGGGKWDGNTFIDTQNGGVDGAQGQGMMPIITASSVDFMRAEAALTAGTGEDAKALLESGIRKNMDVVRSFKSRSPGDFAETVFDPILGADVPRGDVFGETDDDVEAYVAFVLDAYDNAADKLDIVMKEAYIARWGNGNETFNAYRRTGKPNNMQPGIDVLAIDAFPKSILLPSEHVNQNANATQKTLSDLVFWDNGSAATR